MEWILIILRELCQELIRQAGKAQARERQEKTLRLLDGQLRSGSVKCAVIVSDDIAERAQVVFKRSYLLIISKSDGDKKQEFESIEELNDYLINNTRFRSGDFV